MQKKKVKRVMSMSTHEYLCRVQVQSIDMTSWSVTDLTSKTTNPTHLTPLP
ncbi:hypothetical protein HanIR_Chr01g0014911 [Helianthus annuus]|nr:hypothetical protein HanIR_Chr01g0014911 [Helianthus annuus]